MEPRSRKFLGRTPDEIEKPEEEEEEPDFMETAKAELAAKCEKERDEEMNEILKKTGAKGKESLLSIHRKRKKEVDQGPKERRPFDRDEDLKVSFQYLKNFHLRWIFYYSFYIYQMIFENDS